jgi:hypothetical protein
MLQNLLKTSNICTVWKKDRPTRFSVRIREFKGKENIDTLLAYL